MQLSRWIFLLAVLDGRLTHPTDGQILPRIFGGQYAAAGQFPAQVSIQDRRHSHHSCGGSLIDVRHIVTAAHCLMNVQTAEVRGPRDVQIVGDDMSVQRRSGLRQTRLASHIFLHPEFNMKTYLNDIAVVRVSEPFRFTSSFKPVEISSTLPEVNAICQIAGWGRTESGSSSDRLRYINATVISKMSCNWMDSYRGQVLGTMFCAGTWQGGSDACQGDSGGGLICDSNLAGVASVGSGCARPNFPGIYTDVSQFHIFIAKAINYTGPNSDIPLPPMAVRSGSSSGCMSMSLALVAAITSALW